MPTPRPEISEMRSAVLNPGEENEPQDPFRAGPRGLIGGEEPFLERLVEDGGPVEPAAVIGDLDADVVSVLVGAQAYVAFPALAGRDALLGRLDPVVHRVANEMHERLANTIDHLLVDLRFLTEVSRATTFRLALERSRTTLLNLLKTLATGSIRAFMMPSCRSRVMAANASVFCSRS